MYITRILAVGMAASLTVLVGGSIAQATRTVLDLKSGPVINSNDVSNLAVEASPHSEPSRARKHAS